MSRALLHGWRWPAPLVLWLCLLAGYAAVGYAPVPAHHERSARVAAILLAAAVAGGAILRGRRHFERSPRAVDRLLVVAGAASVFCAGASLRAEVDREAWPLPVHPHDVAVSIEGVVVDAGGWRADRPAAVVLVHRVQVGRNTAIARSRITLRLSRSAAEAPPLRAGMGLRAEGRYRPPEDARNFGVPAPGAWQRRRGLHGTIWARSEQIARIRWMDETVPLRSLVRESIAQRLDSELSEPVAALASGMILGERSGIAPGIRDSFRNGGTIHILSISGLHVCILAGLVSLVGVALRLSLRAGFTLEIGALWAYVLLVGVPAPAFRAAVLWTAMRAGRLRGHAVSPLAAFGAAGLLLQLLDPRAPLDPGFQLSFTAVLGLGVALLLLPAREKPTPSRGRLARYRAAVARAIALPVLQSAGATAATTGLQAALMGSIPWIGLLLNAIVVPLCALVLAETVLFLFLSACGVTWLEHAAGAALDVCGLSLLLVNRWGATLATPFAVHAPPAPLGVASAWLLLAFLAGWTGTASNRRGGGWGRVAATISGLGAAALLQLVPASALAPPVGYGRAIFFDVGQGDACLIAPPAGVGWIVDAGPADDRTDAGRSVIDPALRAESAGTRSIGVLTHAHRDHYGGFPWLLARGWIGVLFENGSDADGWWRRAIRRERLRADCDSAVIERDTVRVGAGVGRVSFYRATRGASPARTGSEENDRSVVMRFELGGVAFGLLGDLEAAGEDSLRSRLAAVDVLKVPHHGGRTSSGAALIERLSPRVAIVSTGVGNRYGHPSRAVLGRYRRAGALLLRTDEEGAVRLTVRDGALWIATRAHPAPIRVALNGPGRRTAAP